MEVHLQGLRLQLCYVHHLRGGGGAAAALWWCCMRVGMGTGGRSGLRADASRQGARGLQLGLGLGHRCWGGEMRVQWWAGRM